MTTIYDFNAERIDGTTKSFSDYKDQVLLIVNTASKCGFTPQFEGLEALFQQYKDQGLMVIGFPCNQFGNQDPANNDEIGEFCQKNYGVSFPMMAKVDVNGGDAHPVFEWLKNQKGGLLTDGIKWNFTKFLIDSKGQVIARYAPTTKPEALKADIEQALAAK
ncbi:glutathione peroxidase [Psychrobacter cryohalolentis]|uniref:Glutathione peroxidase n=1 Tax=Psychrobacter cryohalolentis (strain ATCC BAA-1226 / DSM 17306 / VKM B-2378 / K5) TaxID=335284 RepID=Q1QCX6_PSYCK|nr:glutathione peroxidase [Psychrobacter cryohalolentis]ABE74477.1 Glutathione peroxidase [Psychrobacter cryohalolentis K5]ASE27101.1 glutathione peroxidase [Psychrobacter cryohalolentis]